MSARSPLRAEIERNVFSNTPLRLFVTCQSVCGIARLFVKKELGPDAVCSITRKSKRLFVFCYLLITIRKLVRVVSAECRKNVEKKRVKLKKSVLKRNKLALQ